ncbi:DNA phosphorothioation-associated putative methyltransferase [Mycolicibacterium peregrinum]|uniref:DNA phosphorothioation-associated putative methyltransferase n=1 Tax=Mycolicibacterium peregrinum TaxID=43304 RepID=A0A4Z0HS45_MYCPR|nr:DNA phosphorothioation-associated putative methyltransferase [Mycolicibacterium peregrinum]TGB44639.1 DNA phosphorothioation-associated putative methyltransferase [Mycolicibacterium peregrinum]TGB46950.1 DNA phosphorothioation-associated putative methyltransferase [Mycolicibacterium peregrinum]
MTNGQNWSSSRQRTAIGRGDLSMPLRQSLIDEVIRPGLSVLDYGAGRGQDAKRLQQMGISAIGWDPYFSPDTQLLDSNVVLLTYVLNVIEDPVERRSTLEKAWQLAADALVVSTRLKWEMNSVTGEAAGDGIITSRGTFQHFFSPHELRQLVEEVTGKRCVSPVPGVVYAFQKDEDRFAYLARGTVAEFEWSKSEDYASAVAELVLFTEKRGRPPLFEEIPADLIPQVGKMSRRAVLEVINKGAATEKFAEGFKRTTLDTLLYLGTSIFSGRVSLGELPLAVQADIKHCFKSYKEACARADRLLVKIRDDKYVRGAMQNSPGKLTATALYVHRRAVPKMPVVLRLYEFCGSVAAGRPADWNILKLDHRGRRVSWSSYPEFDTNPHPTLDWTYGVEMSSLKAAFQRFGDRENRPLLHRKEEFLDPADSDVEKYRRLTAAEVRAGLYQNPTHIGLEHGWAAELARCGVTLRGHRVVKSR